MAAFNNPNLAILELVAQALGPVCDSVIFVGGCATGLLLTQERPDRIRITEDVDIVAQALTVHDYHAIEDQVRAQGFSNDMRPDAPICRWEVNLKSKRKTASSRLTCMNRLIVS